MKALKIKKAPVKRRLQYYDELFLQIKSHVNTKFGSDKLSNPAF
jgi:hypothetical protein